MSKDGVQYAGEYELKECKILSPNGNTTDLKVDMQIVEINLFEGIFQNSISGSLIVVDIENVISKLPIVGQESLILKLVTPSLKKKEDIIDFTQFPFFIHKVGLRTEISVGAQTYEMQFVSPELVLDSRKRLSKSYVGTKSNIGEMVIDVLRDSDDGIKTNKDLFVEPTIGTRKIIVPNSRPFSLIKRLAKEAISTQGSPHYVFFENKNGIHFRSIQELFKEPIRAEFNVGDEGLQDKIDLVTNPTFEKSETPASYKRALSHTLNIKKDMLVNASTGMIGGKVIEHNLFSKKLETDDFNYLTDGFEKSERIDNERIYTPEVFGTLTQKLEDEIKNSSISVIPISKQGEVDKGFEKGTPNQRFKTILDRQSRMTELLNGISINMIVHGQTLLAAGDMVDVTIPPLGGNDDDPQEKYYSGKYIIKTLRHTFDQATRTHIASMEVVKDGLPDAI